MTREQLLQDYSNTAAALGQIEHQIQELKQNKNILLDTLQELIEKIKKLDEKDENKAN